MPACRTERSARFDDTLNDARCPGGVDQTKLDACIDNLVGLLAGARDAIARMALLPPDVFDEGLAAVDRWRHRPDAGLWFALSWAEGRRGFRPAPPPARPGRSRGTAAC